VTILEQIARSTVATLERIEHRFDAIDLRFDAIERRLETIDHRFEAVDRRMDEGFREQRNIHDRDFRLTWAGIIALALGLAALMAHGFHWF